MNHGDHGGHDMPMGPKCELNMLWNTQIENTCIVFQSWHISSKTTFALSLLVVVGLGVLYEWLRVAGKRYDVRVAAALKGKGKAVSGRSTPAMDSEEAGLLTGLTGVKEHGGTPVPFGDRLTRATLYGASVFLSFFLMLVFMTYNAYLILATVVGAAAGHYIFSSHMDVDAVLAGAGDAKGMACH